MRTTKSARDRKNALVTALLRARQALLETASSIPVDQRDTPCLGTWSVTDLVAHLAGWDYANLAAINSILSGRLPDFYQRYDTDWRTFNAELVAAYKRATLADTIVTAQASHKALVAELDAMPAEDMIRDFGVRSPRGRRVTVDMLLAAETRDEQVHAAQLRKFVAR